jgi:N-formylglutamate amidohydrolase
MTDREPSFTEILPATLPVPVLLSSPHSGTVYPDEVLHACALQPELLRVLEDGPTHLLAQAGVRAGAVLLAATFARAYVDLNRSARELDPALLGPAADASSLQLSAKVHAGLGVVPSRIAHRSIWRSPLGAAAVRRRLAAGYLPYHRRLAQLMRDRVQQFGAALLIDLHSMPCEAAAAETGRPIGLVIGDRYGASCDPNLVEIATRSLQRHGFAVARNRPYAGGFITEHYGRPQRGWHALQIEVRRDLFMDAHTRQHHAGAEAVAAGLHEVVRSLTRAMGGLRPGHRLGPWQPAPGFELELPELLCAAD